MPQDGRSAHLDGSLGTSSGRSTTSVDQPAIIVSVAVGSGGGERAIGCREATSEAEQRCDPSFEGPLRGPGLLPVRNRGAEDWHDAFW